MFSLDIILGMLILSGISMACLGLYGRRFTDRIPAAVPYILIMFLASIWAVVYALEILAVSFPQKIFFHNLRFLVLPFFPVLELWLVIAFVKKNAWLRKDWAAAVLIIPVAAVILAITSPFHTLFRYNFSLNTSGPLPILQYSESPFVTLYLFYSLILLVIAIIILIVESRKRETLWTEQTIILLFALAFPTLINYLFVFDITPVPGINLTAPLLWVSALLYTIALFRYRFLDLIPIARSRLIESMRNPMIVLEMGGQIIDMNPTACSLFSTTTSASIGKQVNTIAPDWPDFLSLCQSDGTSRTDFIHVQEGSTRFYEGTVELIRTPSGEPEGRLVLLQDITTSKLADGALRESEAFNRGLVENLPEYILVYGPGGKILYVNHASVRALGYNAEELVGTSVLSYVAPESRDIATAKMAARREGINPSAYELDIITHDGHRRTVIAKGTPIQYHDTSAILALLIDITDRKRADDALRKSEEKYRQLVELAQEGIWAIDAENNTTYVNPRMAEMLGYTVDEMQSLSLFFFMDDAGKMIFAQNMDGVRLRIAERLPFEFITKEGGRIYATISASPLTDNKGAYKGSIAVISDITDRKRADDALHQANKQLNLLSNITRHDILNQLMALKGYLYLSKEMINNPTTLAGYIQKEEQAANTIEHQITFTKNYQELGVSDPVWQNVNASIKTAVARLSMRDVRVEVDPVNHELFADPLFEKVFYNLIDNALRYGGADMKTIRVFSQESDTSLTIICEDDGVGITAEDKKRLFTRGFGKNTGLGLFLSREILAITGITITENGVPGKGARFEITVPKGAWRMTGKSA